MLLESYQDEEPTAGIMINIRSAIPGYDMPYSRTKEIEYAKGRISDGWYRYKNTRHNKVGFLDKDKNLIIDFIYDEANAFSEGFASVQQGEKWGFIDENKSVVIDFQYDNAYSFREGFCIVFEGEKGNFIDKQGKKLLSFSFDSAENFLEGYAVITINDKKGIVNQQGQLILPAQYDKVFRFFNDRACVIKDGKYGAIDKQGNWIFEPQFDYLYDFEFGFTKAVIKTADGEKDEFFVNKNGRIVDWVSLDYFGRLFNEEHKLTLVEDKNKFGFTDREGNIVIDTIYDDAEIFQEGFANIEVNGKYGFINEQGIEVIKPIYDYYDECDYMRNGHVIMRLGDKLGILNSKGEVVVDFIYNWMESFVGLRHDGDIGLPKRSLMPDNNWFILVEKDNKFGVMSMTGEITIPVKYEYIQELSSGLVLVSESEHAPTYFYYADGVMANEQGFNYFAYTAGTIIIYWQNENEEGQGPFGYVDIWGNVLTPPQYKYVKEFGQYHHPNSTDFILAPVMNYQNKWGYIDATGKKVIASEFDDAMPFATPDYLSKTFFALVKKGETWGYIKLKGDTISMPTSYPYSDEDVEKLYANLNKEGSSWEFANGNASFFK